MHCTSAQISLRCFEMNKLLWKFTAVYFQKLQITSSRPIFPTFLKYSTRTGWTHLPSYRACLFYAAFLNHYNGSSSKSGKNAAQPFHHSASKLCTAKTHILLLAVVCLAFQVTMLLPHSSHDSKCSDVVQCVHPMCASTKSLIAGFSCSARNCQR